MVERLWSPSPSPVESCGDASGGNEDGEWSVAVVGEEIRLDGTSRYEVRWDNWQRQDGSNTTWETAEKFDSVELIRRWKRTQKLIRNSLADDSLDMKVPWPDDAVHKRPTDHCKQAYEEKLNRRRATSMSTVDWDAEIDRAYGRLQEPERGEANSKLRVRRVNPTSASGSSAGTPTHSTPLRWSKTSSPTSTVSPRDQSFFPAPTLKRGRGRGRSRIDSTPTSTPTSARTISSTFSRKGKMALTPSSAGSSRELGTAQILPSVIISQPTLRGRISSTWNKAAKEVKAATVRISPDIPDENVPRNLGKFKYMEKGYVFRDTLQEIFNPPRDVFTTCDCMTCSDASDCPCRDLSKVYDLRGTKNLSAYSQGLFTFEVPRGVEVIECNKYCGCGSDCGNRVAQLSRNIGIEIFDTNRCGWGVRALDDIPEGKVLGTYTGTLIQRDEVDKLPAEHQGYLFDLDSTEVRNTENLGGRYTVDSYEYGNWTRFVNHSCGPNMEVYSVVYDTIPYVNMPYVAFVASTDIPAGTELTIDYHPYTEQDKKGKRSAKGGDCRCDSEVCRGWFNM